MEYSNEQQPFLDVLVKRVGTKMETDIYYKPTDSKQYLLSNSCHPKHIKNQHSIFISTENSNYSIK